MLFDVAAEVAEDETLLGKEFIELEVTATERRIDDKISVICEEMAVDVLLLLFC